MRWASAVDTDNSLRAAVEHAAETVFLGLGRQEPDLAVVFVSAQHAAHFDALPALLQREFENVFIFGCCGSGVIGGGREIEDRPAISITGAVLPGVRLKGTHLDAAQVPPVYAEARAWEDALRITASQQPSFLMLADPFSFEAETYIKGMDRIYPLAPKIGGLASGARAVGGTALYLGNQVYHSGCITLALTGNIDIDMVVSQGCRPIGDPMFVTSAHENLVRELDGRSPRDLLSDLFERLPASDRDLFSQSLHMGMAMRTEASEFSSGDFLVRGILGMDPQTGALWVSANVPSNSVVQFHLRDAATSAMDLERALTTYKASHLVAPDAGVLMFSCHGRGIELYGQADHDSNAFRRLVADLPIGGFFCDGEIGPIHNATFLHGYTTAFAVLQEKK